MSELTCNDSLSTYQRLALRTKNKSLSAREEMISAALGITGEAGEVADLIKKVCFHAHELNRAELAKELGDVLWYLSLLADNLGFSLSEIADGNVQKLDIRYPDGFTEAASKARVDVNKKEEIQ